MGKIRLSQYLDKEPSPAEERPRSDRPRGGDRGGRGGPRGPGGGLSCHAVSLSALHPVSSSPATLLGRPSSVQPAAALVSPSVSEQIY